ncbi:MAG: SH3 domain-containing protein [Verrucomicrobia bacterium]|nr:SH3 domain-containing protein [Verrucomicrobiota bacterium]
MKFSSGRILAALLAIGLVSGNAFSQTEIKPTTEPKPAPSKKKAAPKAKKETAKPTAAAPAAPFGEPVSATVVRDRVNIRGLAALKGEVIAQLKKGETVTILDEIPVKNPAKGDPAVWAKIQLPTNTPVWINMLFVDTATKAVKAPKLNVRAGPGENFAIIGVVRKGASVNQIRVVDNWMEIEPPPGTYGFVAAEYLKKGEVIVAKVAEPTPVPVVPIEPVPAPKPAVETPTPAPVVPVTPPTPDPAPVVAEEPPMVKRIITRQGVVARTLSIQAPTAYGLDNLDNHELMNYLLSTDAEVNLRSFRGQTVVVVGEEYVDPRWPRIPIIKIEAIAPIDLPAEPPAKPKK